MERSVVYGVQTIQTTSFETTHLRPLHLRPLIWDHSYETTFIETCWFATHRSFETTFIWDLLSWDPFIWDDTHVRLVFSCDCFDQRKETFFLFLSSISQSKTETVAAPRYERNRQERKTYNSLTWSHKMTFQSATLPSKPEVWRVFCPLRCFQVRVHLQPSVSQRGHGRAQPCKTSNEESPCKTSGLPQRSAS